MRSLGGFMVPLAIALGSLSLVENANLVMRPLLAVAILAGLLCFNGRFNKPETAWIGLLAFSFIALVFSCIGSSAPDAVGTALGRQGFMLLLAISLVMLLRDPQARMASLGGLLAILLAAGGAAAWVYLTFVPVYGFSYEGVRMIKGVALLDHGIGLNSLSYLAVIALFGWRIAYRPHPVADMLLLALGFLCIFLLGSRATLAALLIAWASVRFLRFMWSASPLVGAFGIALLTSLAGLCVFILADYAVEIREIFGADLLREISVGRTDMWGAGLEMWLQRPLFGWGPESWRDLMLEFLPGTGDRFLTLIGNLESGSFHNGFVTMAAERGTLGLLSAIAIQIYLFRCAVQLYRGRDVLDERDRMMATLAPTLVLFMFLRSLAESSGLFGTANGEVDYMTYFVSSYFVALYAEIERRKQAHLYEQIDESEGAPYEAPEPTRS
ncbi:MAG: O-antigen ligase family protein [Alphaproteobacteria bacterium]